MCSTGHAKVYWDKYHYVLWALRDAKFNRHESLLLSGGLQLFFLAMSFLPW
jgi:hypothetical protein